MTQEALPNADVLFAGSVASALEAHPVSEDSSIVVVTRSPEVDIRIIPSLLDTPARYIGVMGSRNRWRSTREQLLTDGIPAEALERLHVPIGIEINAETLEEIAISIMSEVVKVNRAGVD